MADDRLAERILDSIDEGVITVGPDGVIQSLNRAAEALTGLHQSAVMGLACEQVFGPLCGGVCAIADTLATRQVHRDLPVHLGGTDHPRSLRLSTALLKDDQTVVGAVGILRDVTDLENLRREIAGSHRFGDLIGHAPAFRRLLDELPAVAASPSTVLIRGESGTGKELVARALHQHSAREGGPFVAVNCGALPESLLEAELFGVVKGAYTGADRDRPGRFQRADGGTLFLDEVGEMPAALQVRLLRVLQEREVEAVGAVAPQAVDVRVIAATHRDLQQAVSDGHFRLDLYYRLAVVPITLPPLRHRLEDLPLLTRHFIDRFNRLQGRRVPGVADAAMRQLADHPWPGNIRELEHAIERAFVRCGDGPIQAEHLDLDPPLQSATPVRDPLAEAEANAIRAALAAHGNNRTAAARALGIHRVTLQRKIKQFGLG